VACPRGTELYAIGDGEIVDCADGQPDPAPRRYTGVPSNWIILKFTFPSGPYKGKTGYAYYQHLTKGGVLVRKGQRVKQDQLIGKSGSSGNSTGPHLHLTVLKPGYTMNRSTRYTYLGRSSMVVWPLSDAWKGTTYDGKVAASAPAPRAAGTVNLANLKFGKTNDDVKVLQAKLGVQATGYYGPHTDKAVRDHQRKQGWTPDAVNKSSVGPRQAALLGLKGA
jgi:murein DD-endopeptidase MepM/ murein hydrolase activator NlpD